MDDDAVLAEKLAALLPRLNEQQRRFLLAAEARALGHGGVTRLARLSGVSRPTITKALHELEQLMPPPGRVRRVGGGRKKQLDRDPTLLADLEALVEPDTRGDPMSPLRWTCKSLRQLADALAPRHRVSYRVVGDLLRELGYSLQAPAKMDEGSTHPDRDAQFRYLNEQLK